MVRVFQTHGASLSELPQDHIVSVEWTDTLTDVPRVSLRLTRGAALTPANAPGTILIVPSFRESLQVPVYGPFDMDSDYGFDGTAFSIAGAVGNDFAIDFAGAGSTSVLRSIAAQVEGFATGLYEPFLGWTDFPDETDGPNVAKLGEGFVPLVTSAFFSVAGIKDLEALLSKFGLLAYTIVEWPRVGRNPTHRIAVWPLHPLVKTLDDDFGNPQTTWAVQPRVGAVSRWTTGHLPLTFVTPNIGLPNTLDLTDAAIQQFPGLSVRDLLNSPHGGPRPSYRTRRMDVSYRLLGIDQDVAVYHTGARFPVLPLSAQTVADAASPKMTEELIRWNLQNSAATITMKRLVRDNWSSISEAVVAPHQVVTVAARHFPETWSDDDRQFTVREVRHVYAPRTRDPYNQHITATLWQGPFIRLVAEE